MPKIKDIILIKSIDDICTAHNVKDINDLIDYGPGWDTYMDSLCGKNYTIIGHDPGKTGGDWYLIKDENGIEWWLLQEWFTVEEITKPMRVSKPIHCRHHDEPTGIVIQNVMLLDREPVDIWSKNKEEDLVTAALENAGRQLKYRLRSWPVCGNGGEVELWGYLDREAKTVTAHWCCSCQNVEVG